MLGGRAEVTWFAGGWKGDDFKARPAQSSENGSVPRGRIGAMPRPVT